MYILAPILFLPPAGIPPGKEQTLLCNHPHPQKWMEETPTSAMWAPISCLQSPPCCLSLVLGLELFSYLLPCCFLSVHGINSTPSKLHSFPPMIHLRVPLECPSEAFQSLVLGHAKLLTVFLGVCGCWPLSCVPLTDF